MPATVMLLLSQFLIHPYLTTLSDYLTKNNYIDFKKNVNKLIKYLSVIGVIAIIGAYLIGIPVLQVIYGVDLHEFRLSLSKIIIGSTLFGISFIISSALVAMRIDKEQTIIYMIQCVICFVLNYFLIKKISIFGAFDGYILSMITLLIMYYVLYKTSLNKMMKKGE